MCLVIFKHATVCYGHIIYSILLFHLCLGHCLKKKAFWFTQMKPCNINWNPHLFVNLCASLAGACNMHWMCPAEVSEERDNKLQDAMGNLLLISKRITEFYTCTVKTTTLSLLKKQVKTFH